MEQMFRAKSKAIEERMHGIWNRATEVAGIAHVLCKHYTKLKPDQATLGGLVHEIGSLPILTFSESKPELVNDTKFLDQLNTKVSPKLGLMILRQWDFPVELQQVPGWMSAITTETPGAINYVDVIIAAKLQSLEDTDHLLAAMPWSQIPAFAKLGINTEDHDDELDELTEEIDAAQAMLKS
jgi:HD-like signal output (HDOD) protein